MAGIVSQTTVVFNPIAWTACAAVSEYTKVRAADSVRDHSAKAIELEDIEVRVAELERAAEAAGRQGSR